MADHGDIQYKINYLRSATGIDDIDLCTDILAAHNFDLNLAVSSIISNPNNTNPNPNPNPNLSLAWKLVTLPFYAVSGAVGLGFWLAGGLLSRLLPANSVPPSTAEAANFVSSFNQDFEAPIRPNFVPLGFMDALQRSQRENKLMFVYLHAPHHPHVLEFCLRCLCSEPVAEFVNENFVAWGGSIRGVEGFKMRDRLKASMLPFCAVVMPGAHGRITVLSKIEGPQTPEEMLNLLQQVVEEYSQSLVASRLDAEERRNDLHLREEQEAAYRAAPEANRARECQQKEEQEHLEREAAEAERQRKEEEALERADREAAEKQAVIIRRRQEKAMALGEEPEKGPGVTQVVIRFPNGERKERRFQSSATIESLYNYVDSLDCLTAEKYSLVSNFPRILYGPKERLLPLTEAGLHPQASLFVEIES